MQDSLELQRNYESVLAEQLVQRLPATAQGDAGKALAMLHKWDKVLERQSAAAALYNIWLQRHLGPAFAQKLAPQSPELLVPLDSLTTLSLAATEENRSTLLATLAAAWQETSARLGPSPANWRWGDLHTTAFRHPLLEQAPAKQRAQMAMPELPRGGSANTTNSTRSDANFKVVAGASFRMVLDVGNWDAARMTNAPGQSGRLALAPLPRLAGAMGRRRFSSAAL